MAEFAPEVLFHIGSFPITNTIINTLFVDGILVGTATFVGTHIKKIPGKLQNLLELVISTFYDLTESVAGKNAVKIFPWFMSFFLFILLANWSGLLPGANSIGLKEMIDGKTDIISFFRNTTSDLNTTLGLAIISLVMTHYLSIKTIGFKEYISRFLSFNPIFLFVGILELISEFTKIVSLSFRLFGNIFAGEVVLKTVSGIFAFLFPLPFMFLEIIVGLVQALVFGMLTMVFMSVMMTPHHTDEHHEKEVTK
jgi:F-type H+-transporting ATPase subunit a